MSKKITGLTQLEVEKSIELYGDNSLRREKKKGFLSRFFENLSDPIIKILLAALIVQVVFTLGNCNLIEIFGILSAILISTTVSTVSEYRSERAFEKLEAEATEAEVSVLRDGRLVKINSTRIAVGDVVYLFSGEKIQADGEMISGKITVDQSALNGESREVEKSPGREEGWELSNKNRVFRGSTLTGGSGVMRVMRVGASTFYGMVAKDVQAQTRESPLKLRLTRLATQVSVIGYIIAALVGITFLFNTIVVDNGFVMSEIVETLSDGKYLFSIFIRTLTLMITVIVVAAPEGLPMMITVVLSANMKKMLRDKIHVKKLVGIDTAGSLNILFTDKTGTITKGAPECERIITADGEYKTLASLKKCGEIYKSLTLSAKYNTDVIEIGGEITGGNPTDRGIYSFFSDAECERCEVVEKIPFSSERKYSSITLKNAKTLIKGAAELIIENSNRVLLQSGDQGKIDRSALFSEYKKAAARGERVIAVAQTKRADTSDLCLIALIVMKDKIRKGVKEAVREVTRAGIQTVMITGDSKETATAIATECGIFNERCGHVALDSRELHEMTDSEIKGILSRIRVVSRALPQDKVRLVRLSQEIDLVVGMTGDGINDAPSLKLADVGFAMGAGTDIAKSSADIVILDNSFSALDKTILYGRTIFKSIRKFITFQLIMNLVACGISLVGQFIGIDTPITIIQMLWVNIIMDTLGGLAFAGEPALKYYMNEPPIKRDEPILNADMLKRIFITGAFTLGICILFLTSYVFKDAYGYGASTTEFYTAFYALFIFSGIFNCFAARSERVWMLSNIGKNIPFLVIILAISVIQIIMIYCGGEVFRCTPLSPKQLGLAVGMAFSVIPFDVFRRLIYKLK
ncbi:MAG: calcium-translocating P-type ATPase, PMCA-type [Clostridia bacterium]|nr:calcium-translocating P-type ATPase, PMCA-type [Clostridia bacterium]